MRPFLEKSHIKAPKNSKYSTHDFSSRTALLNYLFLLEFTRLFFLHLFDELSSAESDQSSKFKLSKFILIKTFLLTKLFDITEFLKTYYKLLANFMSFQSS